MGSILLIEGLTANDFTTDRHGKGVDEAVVERFESIGNLKSFEKLCQNVGLKLRSPGRPAK